MYVDVPSVLMSCRVYEFLIEKSGGGGMGAGAGRWSWGLDRSVAVFMQSPSSGLDHWAFHVESHFWKVLLSRGHQVVREVLHSLGECRWFVVP